MTTANMLLVEPVDHASTSVWGAAMNAALDLIDAHDHSPGKGVLVPVAALKANSDVSWSFGGTNYAIKDLKAIDFAAVAASSVSALAGALFLNSLDSELYYRTVGGSNVKVTNGAALNFAAFVGGIGGDYSAVGALESFDDATKRYLFQSEGSPRPWSGMACADIDLYEKAISITNKVTLKSPSALAASYSVTWPAAVPGSTVLMQMSSVGVLTATNTLPINTDITLSGSGKVSHGTYRRTQVFRVDFATAGSFSTTVADAAGNFSIASASSSSVGYARIDNLQQSDTIGSVIIQTSGLLTGSGNNTYDLLYCRPTSGANLLVSTLSGTVSSSATSVTLTPSTPFPVTAGDQVYVKVTVSASGTYSFFSIQTNYTV